MADGGDYGGGGVRPTEMAWPAPGIAWYSVILLLVAYSLSYADRMVMSLLVEPIKADLGISDVQVSLLIGMAFAIFYVLMGIPCGILADRIHRRNLIVGGVVSWSIATCACGLAGGFASLFLARMAVGAGEATLSPSAYSMMSDSFPRHRLGRAVSIYAIGNPLGSGLALALGGVLIALVTSTPTATVPLLGEIPSWRIVFLGLTIPGLLLALLMFTVPEPARRGKMGGTGDTQRWSEGLRYIFTHRALFGPLLLGVAMLSAAVTGAMAWIPAFFVRSHGMAAGDIGFWYGVTLATAGVGGLLLGGIIGDLLYRRGMIDAHPRTIAWAALAAIGPSVAAPLVASRELAFVLLGISVMATGVSNALSATSVQLASPAHLRGQISAIYILMGSIGGIGLGPTVVAAITDYGFGDPLAVGYSLAILAAVVLPLAALLLFLGLPAYARQLRAFERA